MGFITEPDVTTESHINDVTTEIRSEGHNFGKEHTTNRARAVARALLNPTVRYRQHRTFALILGQNIGPGHLKQRQMREKGISEQIRDILNQWCNVDGQEAYLINPNLYKYDPESDIETIRFEGFQEPVVPSLPGLTIIALKQKRDAPSGSFTIDCNYEGKTVEGYVADRDGVFTHTTLQHTEWRATVGLSKDKAHAGIYLNGHPVEKPIGLAPKNHVPVGTQPDYALMLDSRVRHVTCNHAFVDIRTPSALNRKAVGKRAVNAFGKIFFDLKKSIYKPGMSDEDIDLLYDRLYEIIKNYNTDVPDEPTTPDLSELINVDVLKGIRNDKNAVQQSMHISNALPLSAKATNNGIAEEISERLHRKYSSGVHRVDDVAVYTRETMHKPSDKSFAKIIKDRLQFEIEEVHDNGDEKIVYNTAFVRVHPTLKALIDPEGLKCAEAIRRELGIREVTNTSEHVDAPDSFDASIRFDNEHFKKARGFLCEVDHNFGIEGVELVDFSKFRVAHNRSENFEESLGDRRDSGLFFDMGSMYSVAEDINFIESVYVILQATLIENRIDTTIIRTNEKLTTIDRTEFKYDIGRQLGEVERFVGRVVQEIGVDGLLY